MITAADAPLLLVLAAMKFLGPGGAEETIVPRVRAEASSGARSSASSSAGPAWA